MRAAGALLLAGLAGCTQPLSEGTPAADQASALPTAQGPIPPMPATWYLDADGDGWGDDTVTTERLNQPAGWVADGGDCDDANSSIHPDATERCGDSLDEDCDGVAQACEALWTSDAEVVWYGAESEGFGEDVGGAGDLNGDGYDEVWIGAAAAEHGETNAGRLYLLYGSATGPSADLASATVIAGVDRNQYVGRYVAALGDLQGDGLGDLALGYSDYEVDGDDVGGVFLFSGPITGSLTTDDADAVLWGPEDNGRAGYPEAVGDVNGDGLADFAVSAPTVNVRPDFEGVSWLVSGPVAASAALDDVGLRIEAHFPSGMEQPWARAAGDSDGDGLADLAACSSDDPSLEDRGFCGIFSGPLRADVTLGDAEASVTGAGPRDKIQGRSVGDVDGDGRDDLVIWSALESSGHGDAGGAAWLMLGPHVGDVTVDSAVASFFSESFERTIVEARPAGDLDADGRADFLLDLGLGPAEEASIYLVTGPVRGALRTDQLTWGLYVSTTTTGSTFAQGAGAGDVDGDGYDDLIVGSSASNALGGLSGTAWLFSGGEGF